MAEQSNEEKIVVNALAPLRVTGDSGSAEQHPIPDQIEADRYLASKKAAKARASGVRYIKFIPPGATG